jgi:hypothetical protein
VTVKSSPWPTVERAWVVFVRKPVVPGKSPKSSVDAKKGIPNPFNTQVQWTDYLGARGLGVYDVALTWQRSRVRFSPSPPTLSLSENPPILLETIKSIYIVWARYNQSSLTISGSGSEVASFRSGGSSSSSNEKSVLPPPHSLTSSDSSKVSSGMAALGPRE